ncbi:hypothetical protein GCM10010372_79760 [Streptomyces tauricus]|nr:hypothetical protein GCM10010372_79760 [Streptomyces tauricus]
MEPKELFRGSSRARGRLPLISCSTCSACRARGRRIPAGGVDFGYGNCSRITARGSPADAGSTSSPRARSPEVRAARGECGERRPEPGDHGRAAGAGGQLTENGCRIAQDVAGVVEQDVCEVAVGAGQVGAYGVKEPAEAKGGKQQPGEARASQPLHRGGSTDDDVHRKVVTS